MIKLFCWNLYNLNKKIQNVEALDLVCDTNKIVIQVSATCTKAKIESALARAIIKKYKNCRFIFLAISKDASELRDKSYKNPNGISFDPSKDIFDPASILGLVSALNIDKQKDVYDFIKKELGRDTDIVKLDSNLATIINILAREDLSKDTQPLTVNSFEIERKISFNNLNAAKKIVDDYSIHHNRVDKKYEQFDAAGSNTSASVLNTIRMEYIRNLNHKTDDELFLLIIDNIKEKIIKSSNFEPIPIDELELCVNILVVDAFIRCKIFENPNNYQYVTA